jgi:hypothetical protein
MVAIFEAERVKPLDADEVIDRVKAITAPRGSPKFMEEAAHYLQRFSAREGVVRRHIESKGGIMDARDSFVPPQTFGLLVRDGFGLRVNVWPTVRQANTYAQQEMLLYAYGLPHNHDFSFLTVGHFGEGYETDLYEVDASKITGADGQAVELKNYSRQRLSEGRVLSFSAFSDLHTQFVPPSLSISINLIIIEAKKEGEQVFFDTKKSTVIGDIEEGTVGRMKLTLDLAKAFPTDDTVRILSDFADTNRYDRLRRTALDHVAALDESPRVAVSSRYAA